VLDVFAGGAFAGCVVGLEAVVVGCFCDFPDGGFAAVLVVVAVVAGVLPVVATLAALPEVELEPPPQPATNSATPRMITPRMGVRFQIFKPFSLP
jgi:hypothetical protein